MKKLIAAILVSSLMLISASTADAAKLGSVSHIHAIKAMGDEILLGTHEGLYKYVGQDNMSRMGTEDFDVMGLATTETTIYASGHPNSGSKLPQPVGLLSSVDKGKSWKQISLQGKVDFHMLEAFGNEIYGADSGTGNLMYSANAGKSWSTIGANSFLDIAISAKGKGEAFGIRSGKLVATKNSFKSAKVIYNKSAVNAVEQAGGSLYIASDKIIFVSKDSGLTWKKLTTFKTKISVMSVSTKVIVAVTGNTINVSRDQGKSFT